VTASDRTDTQARLDAAKLQDRIAALLPSPRPYSASVQAYAGEAVIVDGPALDALAAELERVTAALREITAHPVISEGEFPDDNCDWHCTAELVAKAESALAAQEDK
jgi:hypothetical protein